MAATTSASQRKNRPVFARASTLELRANMTDASPSRLRSRSLINGRHEGDNPSSAVSPLPTLDASPVQSSSRMLETEIDLSSATTPKMTSPPASMPSAISSLSSSRPRSSSLLNYSPAFASQDIKGKGKAGAASVDAFMPPPPRRKASWLALNILSPFSEATPRSAEHGHTMSTHSIPNSAVAETGVYSLTKPIVILAAIFTASTVLVIFTISSIPTLAIPHDLSEVLDQAMALKRYSTGSLQASMHIVGVLTVLFVYKQAFSIPGSLLTNILFGSLYGVFWSTLITSILTAVGSLLCYLMAYKLSPLVRHFLPKPLAFVESNIESRTKNPADLFSYLLLMRLFPLLPYAVLNIAGGVLAIPTGPFFWTLVLGSIPYNLVTTSAGDLLASLPSGTAGLSSIWTPSVLAKFFLISVCSAVPILFKSQIQSLLGGQVEALEAGSDSDDPEHERVQLRSRRTASLVMEGHSAELEAHWHDVGQDLGHRTWSATEERAW